MPWVKDKSVAPGSAHLQEAEELVMFEIVAHIEEVGQKTRQIKAKAKNAHEHIFGLQVYCLFQLLFT